MGGTLRLLGETYFTFDPKQYNQLFDEQLEKVITRTHDPAHRQALERMRVQVDRLHRRRGAERGYHDHREVQEVAHEVVVKQLLTGGLFRGFDDQKSGPMDSGSSGASATPSGTFVEKEKNRRHYLPTIAIQQEFEPGGMTADDLPDRPPPKTTTSDHPGLPQPRPRRLGGLGVAVFRCVSMAGR